MTVDHIDQAGQGRFAHIACGGEGFGELHARSRRFGRGPTGEFSGDRGHGVHQFNGGRPVKIDRN
ncbi:hypothetical protein GCM10009735_54120 [Actinomadura chokoriensis]